MIVYLMSATLKTSESIRHFRLCSRCIFALSLLRFRNFDLLKSEVQVALTERRKREREERERRQKCAPVSSPNGTPYTTHFESDTCTWFCPIQTLLKRGV